MFYKYCERTWQYASNQSNHTEGFVHCQVGSATSLYASVTGVQVFFHLFYRSYRARFFLQLAKDPQFVAVVSLSESNERLFRRNQKRHFLKPGIERNGNTVVSESVKSHLQSSRYTIDLTTSIVVVFMLHTNDVTEISANCHAHQVELDCNGKQHKPSRVTSNQPGTSGKGLYVFTQLRCKKPFSLLQGSVPSK